MQHPLLDLFLRDLESLKREIGSYENDDQLWSIAGAISNSGGNLALHLIGNLNHFIGYGLGYTDYKRDREGEFNDKNISKAKITQEIEAIKSVITDTFEQLTEDDLQKPYPVAIRNEGESVLRFLIHLFGHLNYHLGQINYHRRLITSC